MDEAWRLVGMAGEAGGPTVGPGEGVLVAVVDWCRVVRRTGRQAFDGVALGLGRIVLLGVPAAGCDVPADRQGTDARVPADPRQRRPRLPFRVTAPSNVVGIAGFGQQGRPEPMAFRPRYA